MRTSLRIPLSLLFLLTLNAAASCFGEAPSIGDKAPAWENLQGTDGRKHSLDSCAEADVIVVCFTCNTCPYAVDYEDRLIALQKKYPGNSPKVQIVAINSNSIPADSIDRMKERGSEKKFNFPYLQDESQEVAKAYGAIYTPEFYVLNKNREVVYRGAMDDSTRAENVKVKYVELAIAAALEGRLPEVTTTGARGCTIRFQRKRK